MLIQLIELLASNLNNERKVDIELELYWMHNNGEYQSKDTLFLITKVCNPTNMIYMPCLNVLRFKRKQSNYEWYVPEYNHKIVDIKKYFQK